MAELRSFDRQCVILITSYKLFFWNYGNHLVLMMPFFFSFSNSFLISF